MNEKIKEIFDRSNEESIADWKKGIRYETSYEKFAELIVRECGVALSPMLRDMISRGQAYDLIKKHFGVEE